MLHRFCLYSYTCKFLNNAQRIYLTAILCHYYVLCILVVNYCNMPTPVLMSIIVNVYHVYFLFILVLFDAHSIWRPWNHVKHWIKDIINLVWRHKSFKDVSSRLNFFTYVRFLQRKRKCGYLYNNNSVPAWLCSQCGQSALS